MLFAPEYPYRRPFRRGRRYRVLRSFTPLEDEPLQAGDVLIYRGSGHSIYDSMDGYFFIEAGPSRRWRRWDISTFDDIGIWTTMFEMLPRRRGWWIPRLLLALGVILLAAVAAAAKPAPVLPQGSEPRVLPIPGTRRSACPLPKPAAGRVRIYGIPGVGTYAAYGDQALYQPPSTSRLGTARTGWTRFYLTHKRLLCLQRPLDGVGSPPPTESLGRPRQPMASLWVSRSGRTMSAERPPIVLP